MSLERIYTRDEAAKYLRCSPSTVKRRVRDGELEEIVDRGRRLYRESALRRYVLERTSRRDTIDTRRVASAAGTAVSPGARLWDSSA